MNWLLCFMRTGNDSATSQSRSIGLKSVRICDVSRLPLTVFAALAIALEQNSLAAADTESLPTFDVVRSAYREAISAIHSIECDYRVENVATSEAAQSFKDQLLTWYRVHQVREFEKIAVTVEAGTANGTLTNRFWGAFDGKHFSQWTESKYDSAGYFPPAGQIGPKQPDTLNAPYLFDRFVGSKIYGVFELDDLFSNEGQLNGWSEVRGSRCIEINFGEHPIRRRDSPSNDTQRAAIKVWLDPAFSYLPRRIVLRPIDNADLTLEIDVLEMTSVPDFRTQQQVAIPKKAMSTMKTSRWTFELQNAIVNQVISPRAFTPVFPEGSAVVETIDGKAPKRYVVGDPKIRKAMVAKSQRLGQTKQPDVIPAPSQPPLAQVPNSSKTTFWTPLFYLGLVGLVVSLGITLARFRRRA